MSSFDTDCLSPFLFLFCPGIEGGFDVEQDQYEEDVKVIILPDRQEVTSEDLATMPDVVRERVRCGVFSGKINVSILSRFCYFIIKFVVIHYISALNSETLEQMHLGICSYVCIINVTVRN